MVTKLVFICYVVLLAGGVVGHTKGWVEILGQNIFLLEDKGLSYIGIFHKYTSIFNFFFCLNSVEALFSLSMKVHIFF